MERTLPTHLHVIAWPDSVIDRIGFAPQSIYTELTGTGVRFDRGESFDDTDPRLSQLERRRGWFETSDVDPWRHPRAGSFLACDEDPCRILNARAGRVTGGYTADTKCP